MEDNQNYPSLSFCDALAAMKNGSSVSRKGWNGAGQFAFIVPKQQSELEATGSIEHREYMALKTAQNDVAVWIPSVSDIFAEDWYICE